MEQQYPTMSVIGGELSSISPVLILVSTTGERDSITNKVPIGSIAYIPSPLQAWVKDANSEWKELG